MSVDVYNRTAEIKGWAQPGSKVQVKIGSSNKSVDADKETGEWTTTVRGLDLGENKGTLETFDDKNESLGESDFSVDVPITELDAKVLDTDAGLRTADVEITGTPGLDIVYQGKSATLNAEGKKTVTFDGLEYGPNNTVNVQQFDGDKQIGGDLDYEINLMIKKVSAEAKFDTRGNNFDAIVSGKSEFNATISIIDSKGRETTTKANPQGVWSTPVKAPGAGRQVFEVSQSINNGDGGSTDTNVLDYGNAVEINTPRNNSEFDGGPLTFNGDGQYQAVVEVFDKGNDKALAETKGLNSGAWTMEVPDVAGGQEHVYTVKMQSKGNLVTEDTVTINPGQSAIAPVVIDNQDGEAFNVGGTTHLSGVAEKSSTVTIKQGSTLLGTAPTGTDGKWSYDATLAGTTDTTVNVTQAGSDKVTSVNLTAPAFTPLSVTSGHTFPGTPVTTVTGKATPFATVGVSVYGIEQKMTADKNGNWSYSRGFNNTMAYTLAISQTAHNGTDDLTWDLGPATTIAPVTIDNKAGEAFNVGGITPLSGTATKNTEVTIKQGTTVLTTVKSGDNGKWAYDATLAGTANTTVNVTQAGSTAVTSVNLTAPAFVPLSITSGHTFPGTPMTTMTGTATPFSTIDVSVFGVKQTVTADKNGNWSYKRGFNNALSYKITVDQTAYNGSDKVADWVLGPAAE